MTNNSTASSQIGRALIIAAGILAVSALLKLMSPEYISEELSRRLLGVLLGAAVLLYANAVPKALTPLARMRCNPATEQSLRRFTGWSLTLGGLMYALAWLFAPITSASTISAILLGPALLLAILRYAWAVVGRSNH